MTQATAPNNRIGVPFVAFTADRLKRTWAEKGITAKTYLECIVELLRPPGTPLIIPSVTDFCKQWSMAESTYYKAVHQLKQAGRLNWKATEGMILWATNKAKVTQIHSSTSVESDSTSIEKGSTIEEEDSTIVESQSTSVDKETLEALKLNGFTSSLDQRSDHDQIRDQKEREKEGKFFSKPPEPEEPEDTSTPLSPCQPSAEPPNQPTGVEEDDSSAASTLPLDFDWESYDWSQYDRPGDGGSDPEFWDYAYNKTEAYAQRKQEPIADMAAYTLTCIRNRAAAGYKGYLQSIGKLPPEPKPEKPDSKGVELHWSDPEQWLGHSDGAEGAIAIIKDYWGHLKLTWSDERLLNWLTKARQVEAFEPSNLYELPSWVCHKLAHDLRCSSGGMR